MNVDDWVTKGATAAGGVGGLAMFWMFLRKSFSRAALDTEQLKGLETTLSLLRQEIVHEREAREAEREEFTRLENTLRGEIRALTKEVADLREFIELKGLQTP